MPTTMETRTLHFDFSSLSPERELTLLAGDGRKVVLHRYADHGLKMDEHRSRNAALAMIPEAHLPRITHFCEEVALTAERPSMRRVVFPSLCDHPLPEIAMVLPHVPLRDIMAAHHRFYRDGRLPSLPYGIGAYGVEHEAFAEVMLSAGPGQDHVWHASAHDIQPPGVTAQAIALQHPELGNVSPGVMCYVKNEYLNPMQNQDMSDFVQYLQNTQPGEGSFTWYNKGWAQWAQNDDGSGPLVPAAVDTGLTYKGGEKIDSWPTPPGASKPGMPTYDLTDEYDPPAGNPANQSVIDAAGPAIRGALLGTKTDPSMNGILWSAQAGVTQTTPSAPTVTTSLSAKSDTGSSFAAIAPGLPGASATMLAADDTVGSPKGFAVKDLTSSYGLYLYDMSFDATTKTVTLPVKNWPSRYLGAYIQFQEQDGSVIKRADILPAWPDQVPFSFVKSIMEPSDSKNYLDLLSSGNAIFGIPVPPLTQISNLTFPWPNQASKAVVMIGGLGCASGFKDWDSDVDVVGLLGTCIMNYAVGAISLVFTSYVVNPFVAGLKGDAKVGFYAVAGVIGASALVVGVAERDTSWGKSILSKLAGVGASAIFGAVAERTANFAFRKFLQVFFDLSAEFMAELSAEEVLECVPVSGWVMRVIGVASDIAALAATTVECILSPATYELEILHTMDLAVTVKPDPTHGKSGFSPVWPAVAEHYVIQVKYPSAGNAGGGTTYALAGPMPGQHDADITVTFPGVPAGGKVEVVASIYSSNDWLAGVWNSGWIDAVPDASDVLSVGGAIVEQLVPLTATTSYSQKQAIAYSDAAKHYWAVSQFSIDAALVVDFDKGGVPDTAIATAFADNGNSLSSAASIAVGTPMHSWTLTDSQSGAVFDVAAKQLYIGKVFSVAAATYKAGLNAGGATPSALSSQFDSEQHPLPAGTTVTVVAPGQQWTIALPGQLPLFELDLDGANIDVKQTGYELTVQNSAQAAPPLPQTYPLSSTPTGNALGALQNIIINDKQFELGYAYLASGQNMPIDDKPGVSQGPMYAMQSISTLGQPQDQIIEPTKGFTNPTFLIYDQFGLTPLFALDAKVIVKLVDGPVPADIAASFAGFGYKLPAGAAVTVKDAGKDWSIGLSGSDALYELRVSTVLDDKNKTITIVGVFDYPIPGLDNFFLEPQSLLVDGAQQYYLRGVKLDTPPGKYTFDYTSAASPDIWGIFQNKTAFQEMAVHPSGYVIGLDIRNAKMFTLKLPANAMAPDAAPLAMPLAGKGNREGLLDGPSAMTVAADGRILILETGTSYIDKPRIQALDIKGNPVPSFSVGQPHFPITTNAATIAGELDAKTVSLQLLELFQQNVTPAIMAKAVLTDSLASVTADLDTGTVDGMLLATLQQYGLATDTSKTSDYTVTVTSRGKLWFVTDTVSSAAYDVRLVTDPNSGFDALDIFQQAGLSVTVRSAGSDWRIGDSVNGMTFDISKAATSADLTVQQLSSWMPLRSQSVTGKLSYLDIASETKGYIYVLGVIEPLTNNPTSAPLVFQLDIYNPDGSPLLDAPQHGLNAGKITVDQYRSLFSLNFNVIIGPNSRTEPGVSQWIPSTPAPAT